MFQVIIIFTILLITISFPAIAYPLGAIVLAIIVVMNIVGIILKHSIVENPGMKILKDILLFALVFFAVLIVGGIVGRYAGEIAGAYVENQWAGYGRLAGAVAGLLSAMGVGYLVNKGINMAVRAK